MRTFFSFRKETPTEPSLVDLFSGKGEHGQQLDHDFDERLRHGRRRRDLGIDLETPQEILDALKDVDEGIVAFPHILGRLKDGAGYHKEPLR